jgi:hypothetical protein
MMSNSTSNNKLKIFIIVCVVVFLTGLVATLTGLALHGWRDMDKLPGGWHLGDWTIQEGSGNMETYTLSGNDAKFEAVDLNLALCDVEYKIGTEYRIELKYDEEMNRPDISITDGILKVKTGNEHFISEDGNGFVMTLEITVPEGTELNSADLNLDACEADFSGLDAKELDVSFDLGELTAEMLSFDKAKFNLNACDTNIQMIGEEADYEFDITNDLGSMTVGGEDVSGSYYTNGRITPYYYELDADLSDVTVTYQWPSGN